MSAREWNAGDPEPKDRPPFIDSTGVTWTWGDDGDGFGGMCWNQQKITHRAAQGDTPALTLGGSIGYDWPDILDEFGPVREATAAEADNVTVVFQ